MARRADPVPLGTYRSAVSVALAGAGGWVGVVLVSRGASMGMGATMGMAPAGFLGAWTLMMAAMMLPSVGPVAALYARSAGRRPGRIALFVIGYLLVWSLLGVPAFLVALAVDSLSMLDPTATRLTLIAILLALAAYQLTPLKRLCLSNCRSPVAELLKYVSFGGPLREVRVGAHHGFYCAGCCWPLMLLLVAAGAMNLVAMLALTVVVSAEKLFPRAELVTRAIAVCALGTAVLLAAAPALLPRL
jgi:predicted metal-binding membrane protein